MKKSTRGVMEEESRGHGGAVAVSTSYVPRFCVGRMYTSVDGFSRRHGCGQGGWSGGGGGELRERGVES
jgi:hypothetical protein